MEPEQVRNLAGWGLTQNDIASFVGWNPQPSAPFPARVMIDRLPFCRS
jgi:hypothetical protein